jgi:cytochrome P450
MSAADTHADSPAFNPFEPGYHGDPYAQYARLREHEPAHHTLIGPWLFTRYDDVERLVRDPDLSVAFENAQAEQLPEDLGEDESDGAGEDGSNGAGEDRAPLSYSYPQIVQQLGLRERIVVLHSLDPPDHTRLRRLISKVFAPGRLEQLRPRAQAIVERQLDRVARDGGMDVVRDLAFPLPVQVISDMLGMPEADRKQLSEWSHMLAATLDPILTPEQIRDAFQATRLMGEYMEAAIAEKRRNPREDLLSALIEVRDEGDALSDEEILDNAIFLYASGHETTVNLIGNGLLALLDHPHQLARLREDPALIANAVEECLRYDSPVQFTRRITTAEVEVEGATMAPGSVVLICLGSANRDPAFWGPTADELDIGREDARRHMSFGRGVHHCLGAALSRVEAQAALGSLARRFPELALAQEPVRNNRIVLRGLDALTVTF